VSAQARPQDYARAIYDLALEAWVRQLREVQKAWAGSPALRAAASNVSAPVAERLLALDATVPGGLNEGVRKVLGTLLEAGQLDQLGSILSELEQLARPKAERRLAHVTSAVRLTDAERTAIQARLARKFGSGLEFQFDVDASLIGGVLLRVGDQVIDGSVAGKLAALRDRLTA
jgi:F-type H+-transporting ATPase subunit delta